MTALDATTLFPHLNKPTKGYVFVVTYGRSGSTLTQVLLNAIPGYCIRGENANATRHIAQMVHVLRNEKNLTNRRDRLERAQAGPARPALGQIGKPQDPWFGAELLDVKSLGRSLCDVFVREVLQLPDGVRVGGFKEIRYLHDPKFLTVHLETLQEFFPGAKLILQTRAHAEVMKSSWWKDHDPAMLARRLAQLDEGFHAYRGNHDGCFHLDHSTYRQGTEALRPLFEFLEEPFDAAQVQLILDTPLTHGKPAPAKAAAAARSTT
jgi:hypothetical protein